MRILDCITINFPKWSQGHVVRLCLITPFVGYSKSVAHAKCIFSSLSGKSSQIPQFLLEANIEPILCTQPRRFAVVAVARMVARARKCEIGEEVGYHIGHSRVFSARYFYD